MGNENDASCQDNCGVGAVQCHSDNVFLRDQKAAKIQQQKKGANEQMSLYKRLNTTRHSCWPTSGFHQTKKNAYCSWKMWTKQLGEVGKAKVLAIYWSKKFQQLYTCIGVYKKDASVCTSFNCELLGSFAAGRKLVHTHKKRRRRRKRTSRVLFFFPQKIKKISNDMFPSLSRQGGHVQ